MIGSKWHDRHFHEVINALVELWEQTWSPDGFRPLSMSYDHFEIFDRAVSTVELDIGEHDRDQIGPITSRSGTDFSKEIQSMLNKYGMPMGFRFIVKLIPAANQWTTSRYTYNVHTNKAYTALDDNDTDVLDV